LALLMKRCKEQPLPETGGLKMTEKAVRAFRGHWLCWRSIAIKKMIILAGQQALYIGIKSYIYFRMP